MASVSESVDPLFQIQKTNIVDSVRIKAKNQYRLYFSDNSGLLMRWDNQEQSKYGQYEERSVDRDHPVTSICAEEDTDGFERIFWGSDNGFVYEEVGESFDGDLIEYAVRSVFSHCKSPRQKKRYHKVTFQIEAEDSPPLEVLPEFSYGDLQQPILAGTITPPEVATGGGIWGSTDNWSEFFWDGQFVGEVEAYIEGQGINVSVLVRGESNYERVHTLKSCTYNFTPRGLKR